MNKSVEYLNLEDLLALVRLLNEPASSLARVLKANAEAQPEVAAEAPAPEVAA